jgi:dihydroorotase
VAKFPNLKFVMEHVTTAEGVAFVRDGPPNLAGTLTAHHLLYNRNALVSERDNDAIDTHTTILHSLTPSLTRSPQRNNP